MSEVRTVEVKKSVLAMYKGLGKTNEEIAAKLGISKSDVVKGLRRFGMLKERASSRELTVTYTDDLTTPKA